MFSEYLKGLLLASGIKADNPIIKEIQDKLGDLTLSEEDKKIVEFNVITREAAKANSDIYNHNKANFMDKVDKTLFASMETLGFSEEEIKEFKLDHKDKTVDAISSLHEKIRDKHKKALDDLPKGAGKEEIGKIKDSFQKQIDDLNTALKSKEGEISQIQQAHEDQLINLELSNIVSSKNYSNKYEKSHALIIADTLIKKKLSDNKIKLLRDNQEIKLKLNDETGADYYQNNEKVSLEGFVTGVLAENNLLAAQKPPEFTQTIVGQDAPKGLGAMVQQLDAQLASVK